MLSTYCQCLWFNKSVLFWYQFWYMNSCLYMQKIIEKIRLKEKEKNFIFTSVPCNNFCTWI